MLTWNRYGKSCVRLVKVKRASDSHELVDLTVDVQLEGAFDAVYVDGDNRACIATDTMKNTVYALARQDPLDCLETFGQRLAAHFVAMAGVALARITTVEQVWQRLSVAGRPHPHAFVQTGGEQWTAVVTHDATGSRVVSGLTNLVVLKTTDSGFAGFPRDRFTTLPDTDDRILATSLTATWTHRQGSADFGSRGRIRSALIETFAAHISRSVQHTLYAMGEAALAACRDIVDITLAMPNRHHLLVDLTPFGIDNPNEIFVATDKPYGLIEATVTRSE